ncbi:MAG: sigma-70 family RNA polymerase sigma factor [Candidatus Eremiobacteraeota bacterium]|nr:sigma-70 family RNA polymerase sigma factor [Candidatus Eremiobacteraeota bacterium]
MALLLRKGQPQALEELVNLTQSEFSRLAYSIVRDAETTRDVLQETYFLVFRRIDQLKDVATFHSWVLRILTNCCYDAIRRKRPELGLDLEQAEQEPDSSTPDLAEAYSRRQLVRTTLAQLSEAERCLIGLREICHLSYEEIAAVLGVPLGTVRSRLSKARKQFIAHYPGGTHDGH